MFIKKISLVVLMGSLFLACGSVGVAQGQAGQMARLKRLLALNETQVKDIGVLLKAHREAVFPLRQDLRVRNHELQNALDTAQPDPNTVGQLVIARNGLIKQLRGLKIKLQSDIAALLTPEQRQKFEQIRARRGARGGRA